MANTVFNYSLLSNLPQGISSFSAVVNGSNLYFAGGVRSQLGTNYIRVDVEAVPSRIELNGIQSGSIRIKTFDENGDGPASVTVLVTAKYTPVSGSNAVLFVRDIITVYDGYGTATLMPRSDDGQGSITIGNGIERTYDISVSASVYDPYYLGETAPDLYTTDSTNFASTDPSQSLGTVSLPSFVKSCGKYTSVTLPSQAIQGSYLNLKNIGGFISLTPTFQISKTTSVQWHSGVDWLPVVYNIIDTNGGTYAEVNDALDRMKPTLQFGGSTLLDAISKASDILSLDESGNNRFINVLSDGEEHGSNNTLDSVTKSILALSSTNKVPVSSIIYKLNGADVISPKAIRQSSAELDSLAISTNASAIYTTSITDTDEFLSAKGSIGSGYFTFEVDFGEEIQISSLTGAFTVGNKAFGNWQYQLGNDVYVFDDWSREYGISDTVSLQSTFARYIRFNANLGICFSCTGTVTQSILNTMSIVYHKKTSSYIFLNEKDSVYPLHQIVIAIDATTPVGGEINIGVNSQKTANWDDYHSLSRPALDNGSKIVMPIRNQLDSTVMATLEQLVSVDGFLFEAKYGKWSNDSTVKVLNTSGDIIPSTSYFAYPNKGYIVFNEKQSIEFILSIENSSKVAVAAEIINRVNSSPIVISGGGYMYSTTETKGLTQKTSSILPEALNVMVVPFDPNVNSTFSAIYSYYDLSGRAEKGTVIKWYINDVESTDLLDLTQWDNKEWKLAVSGDSVTFTVQPYAKGTKPIAGRIIKALPVKLA